MNVSTLLQNFRRSQLVSLASSVTTDSMICTGCQPHLIANFDTFSLDYPVHPRIPMEATAGPQVHPGQHLNIYQTRKTSGKLLTQDRGQQICTTIQKCIFNSINRIRILKICTNFGDIPFKLILFCFICISFKFFLNDSPLVGGSPSPKVEATAIITC